MSNKPHIWINSAGFTLIEVLVTMTIIGIISAIAIPTYTSHVNNTRVNDCSNEVASIRLGEEEFFLQNNFYVAGAGAAAISAALGATYNPSVSALAPTSNCIFNVVVGAPPVTYTITAIGANALAGRGIVVNQAGP